MKNNIYPRHSPERQGLGVTVDAERSVLHKSNSRLLNYHCGGNPAKRKLPSAAKEATRRLTYLFVLGPRHGVYESFNHLYARRFALRRQKRQDFGVLGDDESVESI